MDLEHSYILKKSILYFLKSVRYINKDKDAKIDETHYASR